MKLAGIDIGGTKCAASLGETDGNGGVRLLERKPQRQTAQTTPEEMIRLLGDDMETWMEDTEERPSAIGISCGGPLDSKKGLILSPPNLPGWDSVPICREFTERFGVPAFLCNDANAGALSEWKMGAGKGCRNMIFMTFGTGLGAGLVLNGMLYEGTNDFAGETGHIRLSDQGPAGYGKIGSFEGFCSGGGIAQLAALYCRREIQKGNRPVLCPDISQISTLTAEKVGEAAKNGDPLALEILDETGTMLGKGLSVLVDLLNPEKIVIGSIFTRLYRQLWPAAEKILEEETLPAAYSVCRIVPSLLSESVGDLSALMVASYRLEMEQSRKAGESWAK